MHKVFITFSVRPYVHQMADMLLHPRDLTCLLFQITVALISCFQIHLRAQNIGYSRVLWLCLPVYGRKFPTDMSLLRNICENLFP
jgi:hypothetical protein